MAIFRHCGKKPGSFQSTKRAIVFHVLTIGVCPSSKVFESIVHSSICSCVTNVISEHQHGFMPKRSTSTSLMCLVSSIFNNMERGSQVDTIYTDFKAAFDAISLACLLSKLEKLGIGDPLLSWLKSYLYGRSYKVQFSRVICKEQTYSREKTNQNNLKTTKFKYN